MTAQFQNLAARRVGAGWRLEFVGGGWAAERGGGREVHVLDSADRSLADISLPKCLPGFADHAGWTTAGLLWGEGRLAYIRSLEGAPAFVIRAGWGARLAISLADYRLLDTTALRDALDEREREVTRAGVASLASQLKDRQRRRFDGLDGDTEMAGPEAIIDLCRVHRLAEAIPVLHELAPRLRSQGRSSAGRFEYTRVIDRLLIQRALRCLGERPSGPPPVLLYGSQRRLAYDRERSVCAEERHRLLPELRRGMQLEAVLQRLGGPDALWPAQPDRPRNQHGASPTRLRYDVDGQPPYTLLITLDSDDHVERATIFDPPFWQGVALAGVDPESTIDCSAQVSWATRLQLRDSAPFAGYRIELTTLQQLADEGGDPAELARAALDGGREALLPLHDALAERGDPRAADVRSWLPAANDEA